MIIIFVIIKFFIYVTIIYIFKNRRQQFCEISSLNMYTYIFTEIEKYCHLLII